MNRLISSTMVGALLVGNVSAGAAQGRGAAAAQGATQTPAPRDSTPPAAFFGVTEVDFARRKLESIMPRTGFTVYIIADMEGLAGVVNNGAEMSPGRGNGNIDHPYFRKELTDEINAVIAGARAAGATNFIVNEGHGANNWHSTLPELLDPAAILIRGWPKPSAMQTGLNPKVNMLMIVGAHPNDGSPGIIAHNYAFSTFTVNGKPLNETGIAGFVGAEMGIPFGLAAGDLALTTETREMLGPMETVMVKLPLGTSAAAAVPFARVHAELRAAATRAVQRVKSGSIKPMTFTKPYNVHFCIRNFAAWQLSLMSRLPGMVPDGSGTANCYNFVTDRAESVTNLLNMIEWTVLKP